MTNEPFLQRPFLIVRHEPHEFITIGHVEWWAEGEETIPEGWKKFYPEDWSD